MPHESKNRLYYATHLIGFTSMVAQIVLMRELMVVFYGNELAISVVLGIWLIWTAIGSLLGRVSDRLVHPRRWLASCQCLVAVALPAAVMGVRGYRQMLGAFPGELLGFGHILLSCVLVLAPLCVLVGFQFALACRLLAQRDGAARGVGLVYLQESLGASIGGLLMSLLLIRWLSTWHIVWGISGMNLLGALFLVMWRAEQRSYLAVASGLLAALILATGAFFLMPVKQMTLRWQWQGQDLVVSRNSSYGNLAITRFEDQLSFFENGLILFSTDNPMAAEESSHFALLEHPSPSKVLLVGGGLGGIIPEILKHPVTELDYVELDPLLIRLGQQHLPSAEASWDARVRLHHVDARWWVQQSQPERYDVVLLHLPEPFTAQLSRFYSVEFFQEAKRVLRPGGILAFAMPSSENYLSDEQRLLLSSLVGTLEHVFPWVEVLPGEQNHFVAQKQGGEASTLTQDAELLLDRLRERGVTTQYVSEFYLPFRLNPLRLQYLEEVLAQPPPETRLNFDMHPIAYFYDMLLWLAQFRQHAASDSFGEALLKLRTTHLVVGVLLSAGVMGLWTRRRGPRAVALSVGTTGFSEILFQIVVILAFQVLYGSVYYKLSLILASFMVGLILGSACIWRMLPALQRPLQLYRWTQLAICLYPLLLMTAVWALHRSAGSIPSWLPIQSLFAFLPVVAGFIGGFQFPLANHLCLVDSAGAAGTAGQLYGVDLVGSCVGALLGAIILIPLVGIYATCWLIVLLNATVLGLLLIARPA